MGMDNKTDWDNLVFSSSSSNKPLPLFLIFPFFRILAPAGPELNLFTNPAGQT